MKYLLGSFLIVFGLILVLFPGFKFDPLGLSEIINGDKQKTASELKKLRIATRLLGGVFIAFALVIIVYGEG